VTIMDGGGDGTASASVDSVNRRQLTEANATDATRVPGVRRGAPRGEAAASNLPLCVGAGGGSPKGVAAAAGRCHRIRPPRPPPPSLNRPYPFQPASTHPPTDVRT